MEGGALTAAGLVRNNSDTLIALETLEYGRCLIAAAVIDKNDLHRLVRTECRFDFFAKLLDVSRFFKHGDHDGYRLADHWDAHRTLSG
jgi:hypothetical protein